MRWAPSTSSVCIGQPDDGSDAWEAVVKEAQSNGTKTARKVVFVIGGFLAVTFGYLPVPQAAAAEAGPPRVSITSERDGVRLEVNQSYCWIEEDPHDAPRDVGAAEYCVDKGCDEGCGRPQGELSVHARERILVKTRVRARRVILAGRQATPLDTARRTWAWRVPADVRDGRSAGVKIRFPQQPETYHYGPVRLRRTHSACSAQARSLPASDLARAVGWIRSAILSASERVVVREVTDAELREALPDVLNVGTSAIWSESHRTPALIQMAESSSKGLLDANPHAVARHIGQ